MNTTEYERATIMGTYQLYSSGGVSGDYRGVAVNASGQIILASGIYVASGAGVTVQSGVIVASGLGVLISGQHVFVESGVYLASGVCVVTTPATGNVSQNVILTNYTSNALGVKFVDGKPRVSSMPYTYDIAEGNISGHIAWSKIGYNGDVDTADGQKDVIVQAGNYVFPVSGMQMMIKSSVASDRGETPMGSGAWSVTLYYLGSGYISKNETITLRGTSGNNTVATDILRVNNMRVSSVGGNAKPYGNLSLTDLSGTITYGYISSGYVRQRQCVYTVPASNDLYVTSIGFGATGTATGKDAIFTTYANYDDKSAAKTSGFMMPYHEVNVMDGYVVKELDPPTRLTQTVDLKVTVVVGNNDTKVTTALRGWIE